MYPCAGWGLTEETQLGSRQLAPPPATASLEDVCFSSCTLLCHVVACLAATHDVLCCAVSYFCAPVCQVTSAWMWAAALVDPCGRLHCSQAHT